MGYLPLTQTGQQAASRRINALLPGLLPPREKPLPGPPFLSTLTVPAPRRPGLRSPPHRAYHALFPAASPALKHLAKAEPCLGTHLPGFPGLLPP
jgi:hypothetical protein